MRKTLAWRVAQVLVAAAAIWFAWLKLVPLWPSIVDAFGRVHLRPGPLCLSCALVLASYCVLIETWRRIVNAWGSAIAFGDGARVWLVSNLAKWIPAMQIAAMGGLARQAGASPFAAIGASLLIQIVNLLAGIAVILLMASDAVPFPRYVVVALGALAVGVVVFPQFLPRLARWAGARFGREVSWPAIPYRTILLAYAGCALAWVLYGIAFQLLVSATLPDASGATRLYIAVFTASYMAGYIALLVPGGLGIREGVLIALMSKYGMATVASATVISVIARVWLSVIELAPGLVLLALFPQGSRSKPNG
jgi:hypothetical protein